MDGADDWKRLCSHAHTESRILSRLEETGLLSTMKETVLKEVIKPSVEIGEVERTVYETVNTSSMLQVSEPHTQRR